MFLCFRQKFPELLSNIQIIILLNLFHCKICILMFVKGGIRVSIFIILLDPGVPNIFQVQIVWKNRNVALGIAVKYIDVKSSDPDFERDLFLFELRDCII